jgi:hypothetical protein
MWYYNKVNSKQGQQACTPRLDVHKAASGKPKNSKGNAPWLGIYLVRIRHPSTSICIFHCIRKKNAHWKSESKPLWRSIPPEHALRASVSSANGGFDISSPGQMEGTCRDISFVETIHPRWEVSDWVTGSKSILHQRVYVVYTDADLVRQQRLLFPALA